MVNIPDDICWHIGKIEAFLHQTIYQVVLPVRSKLCTVLCLLFSLHIWIYTLSELSQTCPKLPRYFLPSVAQRYPEPLTAWAVKPQASCSPRLTEVAKVTATLH